MIAVVDDDAGARVATYALLRSYGYTAVHFASAEDFLDQSSLDEVSCVISDVRMPGMSGIELQQELLTQRRSIPVIFVTAFPDEATKTRAISAGAYGFLRKPYDSREMVQCLSVALGERGHAAP